MGEEVGGQGQRSALWDTKSVGFTGVPGSEKRELPVCLLSTSRVRHLAFPCVFSVGIFCSVLRSLIWDYQDYQLIWDLPGCPAKGQRFFECTVTTFFFFTSVFGQQHCVYSGRVLAWKLFVAYEVDNMGLVCLLTLLLYDLRRKERHK